MTEREKSSTKNASSNSYASKSKPGIITNADIAGQPAYERTKKYLALHAEQKDSTRMYPLQELSEKPREKLRLNFFLQENLAVLLIYFAFFYLAESMFFKQGLEERTRVIYAALIGILAAGVYFFILHKDMIKDLKLKTFTQYELGRLAVMTLAIDLITGLAFIYYIYFALDFFDLLDTQIILLAMLLLGDFILLFLSYELVSYVFFGLLTFLVSILSFSVTDKIVAGLAWQNPQWSWLIAQTVSFILAVLFAFFTNRNYVFANKGNFWQDFWSFLSARIASTLIFEYGGMYIFINVLALSNNIAKLLASILVTLANYFISKLLIFRSKTSKQDKRR